MFDFGSLIEKIAALSDPLSATLDDVSAAASKAAKNTAGVIMDDRATCPEYMQNTSDDKELSVILKIFKGSILNKIVLVLSAFLMNHFVPSLIVPCTLCIAAYLGFEGTHKIVQKLEGSYTPTNVVSEAETVRHAIITDFMLSAEIIFISLSLVIDQPLEAQVTTVLTAAFLVTVFVYTAVSLIVKIDDLGLFLRKFSLTRHIGNLLVFIFPYLLKIFSFVGTVAMLSVSGAIYGTALLHYGYDVVTILFSEFTALTFNTLPFTVSFFLNMVFGGLLGAITVLMFRCYTIRPWVKHS